MNDTITSLFNSDYKNLAMNSSTVYSIKAKKHKYMEIFFLLINKRRSEKHAASRWR